MVAKTCHKCFEPKPFKEFKITKAGYTLHECNDCRAAYQKRYQDKYKPEHRMRANEYQRKLRLDAAAKRAAGQETIPLKQKKCAKRLCQDLAVEYNGIYIYCKSHAFDHLNKCQDV